MKQKKLIRSNKNTKQNEMRIKQWNKIRKTKLNEIIIIDIIA